MSCSFCLRRLPARPRRPPVSSPLEARTGVPVLRAKLCIRLFIRLSASPLAAPRAGAPHKTTSAARARKRRSAFGFPLRACIPHKNFISVSSVRRARALLSPRRRNKPAPLRPCPSGASAPRTGLRPRAAGCASGGAPRVARPEGSHAARAAGPLRSKVRQTERKQSPFVPHCLSAELYLRRNPQKFRRGTPILFLFFPMQVSLRRSLQSSSASR